MQTRKAECERGLKCYIVSGLRSSIFQDVGIELLSQLILFFLMLYLLHGFEHSCCVSNVPRVQSAQ